MNYKNLLITEEDNILIVTMNRPKALNALNGETMMELKRFFGEDAPNRDNIKGIIITGSGEKSFVAGADIKEFLALNADSAGEMAQRGHDIFFSIERFPKP